MVKQVWKKFIRFCWTNNINTWVIGLTLFLSMLTGLAKAQESDIFPDRLANIRDQLELLSDSLAPGLNEYANLSVSGISLQTFLRSLAEAHNLNIQVDPSITI